MSQNIVGSAYVEIHAITDKIGKQIQDAIKNTQISGSAGNHIGEQLGKDVTKSLKRSSKDINKYGELASQDFNKHFVKSLFQGQGLGKNLANALAQPMSKAGKAAEEARQSFVELAKTGTKMPAIFAAVAGTVGDVVGGLGGMIFGAAAAAPAFVAFAGTIVSAGIGMKVMKLAMDGVQTATSDLWKSQTALNDSLREASQQYIDIKFQAEGAALAQQGAALQLQSAKMALIRAQDLPQNSQAYQQAVLSYKQANLNYTQSIHKTQEATRAVRKGITATAAYQPFASLSGMQLALVKFLVTLRPAFQSLRTEVSNGFIPYLKTGIQDLVGKTLPALRGGIVSVSSGMGKAVAQIFKIFTDPKNIGNLKSILKGAASSLPILGDAVKNVFSLVLRMLSAAQPLIKVFVGWIDKTAKSLNDKFSDKGKLTDFFNNAGVVAAKLGGIIGNVASILGSFIKANTDPGSGGQRLLDWIQHVSGDFADFLKTASGASGTFNWFQGAATNFMTMSHAVWGFVKPLFQLAGSPQIRAMWINIGAAAPYMQNLATGAAKAAPWLGGLIKQILRLVALFIDSSQIIVFFKTLELAARKVADFFSLPMVQSVLKVLAPIAGLTLAFSTLFALGSKAIAGVVGHLQFLGKTFGIVAMQGEGANAKMVPGKLITGFQSAQAKVGSAIKGMLGGLKRLLTGQRLATGATYKFDEACLRFRNTATGQFVPASEAMSARQSIFTRVTNFAKRSVSGFGRAVVGAFKSIGKVMKGNWLLLLIGLLVLAFIKLYESNKKFAAFVNGAMKKVMKVLSNVLGSLLKALDPLIDTFFGKNGLVPQLLNSLMPVLKIIIDVFVFLVQVILPPVVAIIDIIIGAIEVLIDYFMTLGKVIIDVFTGNWGAIGGDIANGITKIGSDIGNTAGAVAGAFTGNNGTSSLGGGGGSEGPNTDGSGSGYGPGENSWASVSKKQQDAADAQLTAAKTQLAAAVKNEKKDPSNKNKTDVAIANAAIALANQAKINAKSAFDQMTFYGSKKGGSQSTMGLSEASTLYNSQMPGKTEVQRFKGHTGDLIKASSLDALQKGANKKGKDQPAIQKELSDYVTYNQTIADIAYYNDAYKKAVVKARKSGKQADINAAGAAFNQLSLMKNNFKGQQAAYSAEFANLKFDPKTGAVTIQGAPGASATAVATTPNATTGTVTPTGTASNTGTTTGTGSTVATNNGSEAVPYYVMIKGLLEADWKAIKANSDTNITQMSSVIAQLIMANGWLQKININETASVEYSRESNIRDQAWLEYTLSKDKKAKLGKVNIGGKNMNQSAFDVLSSSVTGISGVAGFNS